MLNLAALTIREKVLDWYKILMQKEQTDEPLTEKGDAANFDETETVPEKKNEDELIHLRQNLHPYSANVVQTVPVGGFNQSRELSVGFPFLESTYLGEIPCADHLWEDSDTSCNSRDDQGKADNKLAESQPCAVSFIPIPLDMFRADEKPEKKIAMRGVDKNVHTDKEDGNGKEELDEKSFVKTSSK